MITYLVYELKKLKKLNAMNVHHVCPRWFFIVDYLTFVYKVNLKSNNDAKSYKFLFLKSKVI
jgi:hypothetical protein